MSLTSTGFSSIESLNCVGSKYRFSAIFMYISVYYDLTVNFLKVMMLFFHLRKWTGNEREKYWTLVPIIEEYFALLISRIIHWFSVFWEEIGLFCF